MNAAKQKRDPVDQAMDKNVAPLVLRVTDQETARVVAVHQKSGLIVGAGCLLDNKHILTCRHVIAAALKCTTPVQGNKVLVTLAGVTEPETVVTRVLKVGEDGPKNDLALLEIEDQPRLRIQRVDFASPLRHAGKTYSVFGFPGGDQQGRNATECNVTFLSTLVLNSLITC